MLSLSTDEISALEDLCKAAELPPAWWDCGRVLAACAEWVGVQCNSQLSVAAIRLNALCGCFSIECTGLIAVM